MADNVPHAPSLHAGAVPFSRPPAPDAPPLQVGFCGLGHMGYFMARNLANSRKSCSSPVLVYNRTAAKSQKLFKELGASLVKVADTIDQLVTECDIIFTTLANDSAITTVYHKFVKALTQSPPTKTKIFADMSTVYPKLAKELENQLLKFSHIHFVTSPVFGPPQVADRADLVVALGGKNDRSRKEVAFLLVPAVGRKVIDLGEEVEKASTLKLIGNGMFAGANELLAETLTLGEKSGIGQQTVYDLIKEIMPAPGLVAYGNRMVNNLFDGYEGFAIDLGIKDTSHICHLSTELDCPMPAIDNARCSMISARAIHKAQDAAGVQQWDILDWSAMIASSRVAAGLDPFYSAKGGGD